MTKLIDPTLALAADILDDIEKVRIANQNRLRTLTTPKDQPDADGEFRGFGLDESHEDVARLATMVNTLELLERDATRNLEKAVKRHPLGPWIENAKGVGLKQGGRLLATIGDPYWHLAEDRPRMVSELHAYTGYHVWEVPIENVQKSHENHLTIDELPEEHRELVAEIDDAWSHSRQFVVMEDDWFALPLNIRNDLLAIAEKVDLEIESTFDLSQLPAETHPVPAHTPKTAGIAPRRMKGYQANWSADARKRAYNVSKSIVKAGGPYREIYDRTKAKYADATHLIPCVRCGPSGKPAQPGSPLSKAHIDMRGIRAISKAVLKDLWIEAKRIHEGAEF